MKFSADLDETDLALVTALQTAPRASWALVGRALGISPVTAARRWERLVEARLAWVTAYGGGFIARHHVEAFVEVDCVPSRLSSVVAGLVEQPQVASVEHTSGQQDLLLTVLVSDLAALSRLLTDVIGRLNGVVATRSQIVTELLTEGSRWDLRALDRDQRQVMRDGRDDLAVQEPDPTPTPEDIPLMLALGHDGRLGYQELAQRTGMSESTARRRTSRLLRTGVLVPRCEIAHSRSNYPVFVTYRMNVPSAALARVGSALSGVPAVRMCASISSAHNLVVNGWVRSVPDSRRLEEYLVERFPEITLVDRSLTLANFKRMGWILDDEGRAVRPVPIDLWRAPATT
ncbi:AsnC family transcriptional regulator [Streptomyces sp. SID8382]|uniref:Lrp/AsnC family transcriptional regulator n=1 Tax=Streptomyces malaysiensis TaxID=92644 RepID=UPI000C2C7E59|nr:MULTISPECIES: Lrp/AsnC family transcriptional regulator [unclassified Streptomyces]AUA08042.1 Leucine-responsive regulatory protein [Streptomyces sp. M56]MYX63019.1 AsnC family transcriptional regulator [Streptomyces sp. SID8382]